MRLLKWLFTPHTRVEGRSWFFYAGTAFATTAIGYAIGLLIGYLIGLYRSEMLMPVVLWTGMGIAVLGLICWVTYHASGNISSIGRMPAIYLIMVVGLGIPSYSEVLLPWLQSIVYPDRVAVVAGILLGVWGFMAFPSGVKPKPVSTFR